MYKEILGIILMFALAVGIALPLGRYISKIFGNEKTWLDKILNPVDKLFYKLSGINPETEMTVETAFGRIINY